MSTVFRSFVNNLNVQWTRPFDITSLQPEALPFLKNMFTNSRVTPFMLDEFYYVGFSYFVDPAPQTKRSFKAITDRAAEQYREPIEKTLDMIFAYFNLINVEKKTAIQ